MSYLPSLPIRHLGTIVRFQRICKQPLRNPGEAVAELESKLGYITLLLHHTVLLLPRNHYGEEMKIEGNSKFRL